MSRVCLFAAASISPPGDYKVVVWFSDGTLYTFVRGQVAWIPAKGDVAPGSIPVLLDGVVYCTASRDQKWLLQYDLTRNKFFYSHLYDKVGDGVCVAAWANKLYVLVLNAEKKVSMLWVWRLGNLDLLGKLRVFSTFLALAKEVNVNPHGSFCDGIVLVWG
ncbi:hypothetical protein SELMODRAFT_420979 [Selaginella moellendorffii]|uniref:Uncharacterized protein n=1 Tax=Selaginella moellendorffii TaxID=88036 RepID=D8SDR3_SELML|nr:hypothetical protein SELMODRAFT_420979 [Selaginella moellendorffii]